MIYSFEFCILRLRGTEETSQFSPGLINNLLPQNHMTNSNWKLQRKSVSSIKTKTEKMFQRITINFAYFHTSLFVVSIHQHKKTATKQNAEKIL